MSLLDDWDKRKVGHTKPCDDCPFRKTSLPGYLGGYRLKTYHTPMSVGMPTSCHQKDFGAEDEKTRFCAGSCATLANDQDIEILDHYQEAVAKVGPRKDCFQSVGDFFHHHQSNNHIFVDDYKRTEGLGKAREERDPDPSALGLRK